MALGLQAFVYGDSFQAVLVGVMVPDEDYLRKNWPGWTNLAAMASNAELKKALMADMERLGKECKLLGFEKVKDIFIPSEPFSMENGLLTPTFKLKRNDAKRAFQAQVRAIRVCMCVLVCRVCAFNASALFANVLRSD